MKADSRSLALALASALVALSSPALAREPYTERSERAVPAAGIRVLELDNARGSTQVRRSPDGQLRLTAYKICRAETAERAKDLARQTTVQAGREGNRYVLRVKYPQNVRVQLDFWKLLRSDNWSHRLMPRVEVRLVAECPEGIELKLHTVSGDVSSEGIVAPQTIEATSGDIAVKDARLLGISTVSGDVSVSGSTRTRVESTSGDLELVGAKGAVDAHTVSGTIVVTQATDSLRIGSTSGDVIVDDAPKGVAVGTVSGDVRIKGVALSAHLSSASGDIRARLRGPLRAAEVKSSSGELWVDLAGGMDATLDITSASGSIDCRIPLTLGNTGRRSLTGRYGRGGAPIILHSASGDITVTSGGR
ncbi:MAG: DUF4097 family beta strand repeat-containing protein [Candidatus Eisenbacteria bacterium]